jgi:predicted RNA-binding protein with RPS1 domain
MERRRLCSSSLLQSSTVTTPSSTKAQKVTTVKNELKSKKTQTKNNQTLSKAKSTQTNGTPKKESSMTVVSKQQLKQSNSMTKKTSTTTTTTTKGKSRVFVRAKKNAAPMRKISNNGANSTSSSNASSIIKTFKPLKDLKLGSLISGTVVDVCDFGAFINIGYATYGSRAGTALLHISQIQDKKISNIHDILKVGDTIKDARVTSIDLNKGEVGLSLRSPRSKRRDISTMKVGDELTGKVDSIVSYGVFVDVGTNVNALLHISRITGGAIENVRQHLNEGDSVSVHVIDIDTKKKTLAVSMLDKKADQYLDRRMSQRLKRFYGSTATSAVSASVVGENDETSDLDYFEQAIRELEEALRDRTQ